MTPAHKYARIETERRFLLRSLPDDLDKQDAKRISDLYWPGTRMRLRRIETLDGFSIQLKLTQKYTEPGLLPEETIITNQYLTEVEYAHFSKLPGDVLVKHRYRYLHKGGGYSIDQFEGHLTGLLLAEIEAGYDVVGKEELPGFAVCEVTELLAFTGGELAHMDAVKLADLLSTWLGDK